MKRPSSNSLESSVKTGFRSIYYWVIAGWLGYAGLTLLNPHKGTQRYNLNATQTNLLQVSVLIPILIIWLIATYGAVKFRSYAESIKSSPDGQAFSQISNGLLVLIAYLISSALVSTLAYYTVGTEWVYAAVFAKNHLPIVVALIAFTLTYRGSMRLAELSRAGTWSTNRTLFFFVPYCAFAVLYTFLFFANSDFHKQVINGLPPFALNDNLLLFTYVLPYLVVWLLACLTALNIRLYARNVVGVLYRKALAKIVLGIVSVVSFTISLQLLVTASVSLNRLNLSSILLLVYLIIILDAVGYIFIALGAKRLVRIEEAR